MLGCPIPTSVIFTIEVTLRLREKFLDVLSEDRSPNPGNEIKGLRRSETIVFIREGTLHILIPVALDRMSAAASISRHM